MATQGIVSIVSDTNKTLIKVIAGCNGYKAEILAKFILENKCNTVSKVSGAALALGFGCVDCLVVMDKYQILFPHKDELPDSYLKTFDNPIWNPRWEAGIASYVISINFEKGIVYNQNGGNA